MKTDAVGMRRSASQLAEAALSTGACRQARQHASRVDRAPRGSRRPCPVRGPDLGADADGAPRIVRALQQAPSAGTVVLAARTDDEESALVLKRIGGTSRRLRLVSDNPAYPPVSVEGWTMVAALVEALGA